MQVKHILRQKAGGVVTIAVGQTVHTAITKLNEHRIGALVVIGKDERVAGIITERDILRTCGDLCVQDPGQGRDSSCPVLIDDVMTGDLIIGVPSDDVNYVMGIMTKNKIRHLPILDDGGLVGMVSIGDVVNAILKEANFENRMLKGYVQGSS
jgi:CBS domain-containing protein